MKFACWNVYKANLLNNENSQQQQQQQLALLLLHVKGKSLYTVYNLNGTPPQSYGVSPYGMTPDTSEHIPP